MSGEPLLAVRSLRTAFATAGGVVPVVRDVSFSVGAGETLGIVGESGSGKSVTAFSIIGLLPAAGSIVGGTIALEGRELVGASRRELRRVRGGRVGIVFQDSMSSLNPLLTIGRQIEESLATHTGLRRAARRARTVELLDDVGVPAPERRLEQYPHQLSGGLRQRVAVAVALAADPAVLIADEPTTALDVTIQAQLLELLTRQRRERDMALILITHDLGVVAGIADRIAVMYAGRIVEQGDTATVFATPRHPYTRGLLDSAPRLDAATGARLRPIPGAPPRLAELPSGCPFRTRCELVHDRCIAEDPPLLESAPGHLAACHADAREQLL